jgi:16S rRNA (adenine1518-N6/adenine1519-N6)-dimethyltransferase
MLRVSLRQLLPKDSPLFSQHEEFLTLRPEQLSISQFVELTNIVADNLSSSAI